jgi:hypothetical protein
MFFVVAPIFSRTPALAGGAREVAKNAKFLSFFATLRPCPRVFRGLREPFGKVSFENHKFQQYQQISTRNFCQ